MTEQNCATKRDTGVQDVRVDSRTLPNFVVDARTSHATESSGLFSASCQVPGKFI